MLEYSSDEVLFFFFFFLTDDSVPTPDMWDLGNSIVQATTLLQNNLENAKASLEVLVADLQFLRDQVTITQVKCGIISKHFLGNVDGKNTKFLWDRVIVNSVVWHCKIFPITTWVLFVESRTYLWMLYWSNCCPFLLFVKVCFYIQVCVNTIFTFALYTYFCWWHWSGYYCSCV